MKSNEFQTAFLVGEANSYAAQQAQTICSPNTLCSEFDNVSQGAQDNNKRFRPSVLQHLTNEQHIGERESSENLLRRRLKLV